MRSEKGLGEENPGQLGKKKRTSSFLRGRITTTNDSEGFIPKYRHSAIAHRTCTDPTLPISRLTLQPKPLRACTRSDDDSISRFRFLIFLAFSPVLKRPRRQVDFGYGLGDNFGPKADGLFAKFVHELGAEDPRGETGEVLNVSCSCELTAGGEAVSHEAFEEDWV